MKIRASTMFYSSLIMMSSTINHNVVPCNASDPSQTTELETVLPKDKAAQVTVAASLRANLRGVGGAGGTVSSSSEDGGGDEGSGKQEHRELFFKQINDHIEQAYQNGGCPDGYALLHWDLKLGTHVEPMSFPNMEFQVIDRCRGDNVYHKSTGAIWKDQNEGVCIKKDSQYKFTVIYKGETKIAALDPRRNPIYTTKEGSYKITLWGSGVIAEGKFQSDLTPTKTWSSGSGFQSGEFELKKWFGGSNLQPAQCPRNVKPSCNTHCHWGGHRLELMGDTSYCKLGPVPTTPLLIDNDLFYTPVASCPNNRPLYNDDPSSCWVRNVPNNAKPFIWSNKFYVQPACRDDPAAGTTCTTNAERCPWPDTHFDGANCVYSSEFQPPNGATALIKYNAFHHSSTPTCPMDGTSYDETTGNCLLRRNTDNVPVHLNYMDYKSFNYDDGCPAS